jgi:hypothetical protein
MRNTIGTTSLVILTGLAAAWQPLCAQSRQDQVAAERNRTMAGKVKACSILTNAEIKEVTGRNQPWELNEEPYDMGSVCDWGTIVTLRVFSGDKPEEQVDWTLKNYKKDSDKRNPIAGFGASAFIMHPTPRDQYEDVATILVGRAGQQMFMLSLIAPDGQTAESVQPQLIALAKMVVGRLK